MKSIAQIEKEQNVSKYQAIMLKIAMIEENNVNQLRKKLAI